MVSVHFAEIRVGLNATSPSLHDDPLLKKHDPRGKTPGKYVKYISRVGRVIAAVLLVVSNKSCFSLS